MIPIVADAQAESDESFEVMLSDAANAVISDAAAQVQILDDDGPATLSIDDVQVQEGSIVRRCTFRDLYGQVARGFERTGERRLHDDGWHRQGFALERSAAAAAARTRTGLHRESRDAALRTRGDRTEYPRRHRSGYLLRADETFEVNLSQAINANIADAKGLAVIQNDDAAPSLTISDSGTLEGDNDSEWQLAVTLAQASALPVTVQDQSQDGTAHTSDDYASLGGDAYICAGGKHNSSFR